MDARGGRDHRRPLGAAGPVSGPALAQHSPFEGPRGAADRETLSNVLRYAEGWESLRVNQNEEEAAEHALVSMMRAAEWT
ncbi:hypothetical protein [Streptomyces sp. SM1]|uniref:hypothetical protein n=1 Tax=Streptomyces sp. SM1 TaxID=402229 RepID=UPI0011AFD5E1|nr:hypothetical protein [Streptomyces sp. SM1]